LLSLSSVSGIQDEGADALGSKGLFNPFLYPKPTIPVSPYVGRLRIKGLNKIRHE
jgi:hypothetical protein